MKRFVKVANQIANTSLRATFESEAPTRWGIADAADTELAQRVRPFMPKWADAEEVKAAHKESDELRTI